LKKRRLWIYSLAKTFTMIGTKDIRLAIRNVINAVDGNSNPSPEAYV
jgi:hypothetical protein